MQTQTFKVRTSHDLCETEAGAKEAERYEQEDNRLQINEASVMQAMRTKRTLNSSLFIASVKFVSIKLSFNSK